MKNIHIFLFTLLSIFVVSCQDPIVVDLNQDLNRIVFDGNLQYKPNLPDSAFQKIKITFNIDFYSADRPTLVPDATVIVRSTDGLQEETLTFSVTDSGYVTNRLSLRPNVGYTTTIIWRGDTYTVTDSVIIGGNIDTLYQQEQKETVFNKGGIVSVIDYTDPAETKNFYQLVLFKNGVNTLSAQPANQFRLLQNDDFFNGATLRGLIVNNDVVFEPGDTSRVEVQSLSQRMYDYYFTAFVVNRPGGNNPPPAPLRSNVVNVTNPSKPPLGYLGIVHTTRREIVIR
ncbi:MAG: DUF4249 family protein [Candidatus Kapabacteria bacterium]|nr:DUF4249 family protein [Candidatus Kapabacteria bacterium]